MRLFALFGNAAPIAHSVEGKTFPLRVRAQRGFSSVLAEADELAGGAETDVEAGHFNSGARGAENFSVGLNRTMKRPPMSVWGT